MQLKLWKHPNAYIATKWNLNVLVITFSTTLTPLARMVSRNDASPLDGNNKRLVCVRGDQCYDHIRHPEKSRLMPLQGLLLHSPKWRMTSLVSIHYEEVILSKITSQFGVMSVGYSFQTSISLCWNNKRYCHFLL